MNILHNLIAKPPLPLKCWNAEAILYLIVLNAVFRQVQFFVQTFASWGQVGNSVGAQKEDEHIDQDETKNHPWKAFLGKENIDGAVEIGIDGKVE